MTEEVSHKLERRGEIDGYHYAVIANLIHTMGFRCGYVRVPPGHALDGKDYQHDDFPNFDVHGGITFSKINNEGGIWEVCDFPAGGTVFGFDCNHYMDLTDPELVPGYDRNAHIAEILMEKDLREGVIRTADYVERECINLIQQLSEYKGAKP